MNIKVLKFKYNLNYFKAIEFQLIFFKILYFSLLLHEGNFKILLLCHSIIKYIFHFCVQVCITPEPGHRSPSSCYDPENE